MFLPETLGQDHHRAHARDRIHRDIQILLRAGVAPMQVLEHQDQRPECRPAQHQRAQRIEQPFPPRRRVHSNYRGIARVGGEEVAHVRYLRFKPAHRTHTLFDLGDQFGLAIALPDAEVFTQLVDKWQQWRALAE